MLHHLYSAAIIISTFVANHPAVAGISNEAPLSGVQMPSSVPGDSLRISIVQSYKPETLRLYIENPGRKRLVCIFRALHGSPLDKLIINDNAESRVFRDYVFSALDDGEYSLEISDDHQTITKKIKFWHSTPAPVTLFSIQ